MSESVTRLSPRQRMINLMYIVLTAMLALNVSSDVLDGFVQVEDGLARTNVNVIERNDALYSRLERIAADNPEKGSRWLDKASDVRRRAGELYRHVDTLKLAIVREVDGEDGSPDDIRHRDDLDAASVVMLGAGVSRGQKLRASIDTYRDYVTSLVTDSLKRAFIDESLSTRPFRRQGIAADQKWEESKFENQPVVAAVTLLTKLQNDICYAEGEALAGLLSAVDAGDVRVNELNAFVVPQSRMVMRGGRYSAAIVLAAVDTTARPDIFIGGDKLSGGKGTYEFTASNVGTFDYSGYIEVGHGDGSVSRHPFSSSYTVMEPTATVSATMMNVLYVASSTFRVRRLPDPAAYITLTAPDGTVNRYRGGKPISKSALASAPGIGAAIDDDMLDIDFRVLGFETVFFDQMGNAIPEVSQGADFSPRQRDRLKRLSRGKRFYISRIRAKGPDGVERVLSPMEIIVN